MLQSTAFWALMLVGVPTYWLLPTRLRNGFLALISVGFLSTVDIRSTLALGIWSVVVFAFAPQLQRTDRSRKPYILGLVLGVLGFLAYFKYLPPLIEALFPGEFESRVLLPLGISYYTFKLIHYIVEVTRGVITDRSFASFACYMYLLPTFSAGPIQRYDRFLADQTQSWNKQMLIAGATRIVHGLIKKFAFGAFLYRMLHEGHVSVYSLSELLPTLTAQEVWRFSIVFYIWVYLDFSAYSDIAIGFCQLFGIKIMENFRFPLIADTIREYWRRWHMTLSGWCQSYIYMPVLGLYRKPLLSLFLTFLVMGLWHEGSWNRVGWGLYHAIGVMLFTMWARFRRNRDWGLFDRPVGKLWGVMLTQLFVSGSMCFLILAPSQGLRGSLRLLGKLVGLDLAA